MLIHCTGQVTTEDASGDGGAHGLGGQALGLAAGADALWGKPMPSFTNGEMQRIVADLLSSRQNKVWLSCVKLRIVVLKIEDNKLTDLKKLG